MILMVPKPRRFNLSKSSFLAAFAASFILIFNASITYALSEAHSAQGLLINVAEASKRLNYSGTFTYEQAGSIKTFKVTHVTQDGLAHERLVYLNGPESVITRSSNLLSCPKSSTLLLRGDILAGGVNKGRIEDYYTLQVRGEDRVAGRQVIELFVMPKDQFRYGYVLSVDKLSGLVLRTVLISADRKQQVLERFQFVELMLNPEFDSAAMLTSFTTQLANDDMSPCETVDQEAVSSRDWHISWLPSGFILTERKYSEQDGSESLVYTDGMAFFTVFIERQETLNVPPVQASRGATVAVYANSSNKQLDYSVCVVGEIPMASAKKIVGSVRPKTDR